MPTQRYNLVADIGGTNARFALVAEDGTGPLEPRSLRCADYPTIVDATRTYLGQVGVDAPIEAAMSVASPVTGDELKLTNHVWRFSVRQTRADLGLRQLKILNDYTALALAVPALTGEQRIQVGPGESRAGHPVAVLGPGTGLGVSGVVPAGKHWVPLESEGGHATYGPVNSRELAIIEVLRERLQHVSAESLVSGPGLASIYAAITRLETGAVRALTPGEISDLALGGRDAMAIEALSIFCAVLGTVAGNLALTLGARGGVYIGGGIVLKILDYFCASGFRERFEQHGRLSGYLQQIPTFVINTDYPALRGAIVALDPAYDNVGVASQADA